MKKQRNRVNWRKGDFTRLEKVVKEFNNKVSQLQKEEQRSYLPEIIDIREVKQKITTKNELTRYLRDLRKFSEKGQEQLFVAESGEELTVWEKNSLQKQANIRLNVLQKELKPYKIKDENGHTKVEMGNTEARAIQYNIDRLNNLFKTKNTNEKGEKTGSFDRLKNYIRYTGTLDFQIKKATIYKENYLQVIRENYRKFDGYQELMEKLRTLSPLEFYEKMKSTEDINIIDIQYQSDSVMGQQDFYKFMSDLGVTVEKKTKEIIDVNE